MPVPVRSRRPASPLTEPSSSPVRLLPGVLLCAALALAAWALQRAEVALFRHAVVEALVMAMLLGVAVRTAWVPACRFEPGIQLTAKQVLEVAVVLLGASVDLPLLLSAGPALAGAIAAVVLAGLVCGYAVGRALGLNPRLSTLIACGNAICGNSAIAAVAPVIGAEREDVASSIAFTAVLGVVVVLGLPLLGSLLGYTAYRYGVLAGMTVYAVPQVLAATFPVSALSGEVGTLVKLVRVLLLGPVVVFFSFRHHRIGTQKLNPASFVPWFIAGFLVLAAARSLGVVPAGIAGGVREVSRWLTVAAMAALGLGVDVRALGKVGPRVMLAVVASLAVMIAASVLFIGLLGIR